MGEKRGTPNVRNTRGIGGNDGGQTHRREDNEAIQQKKLGTVWQYA